MKSFVKKIYYIDEILRIVFYINDFYEMFIIAVDSDKLEYDDCIFINDIMRDNSLLLYENDDYEIIDGDLIFKVDAVHQQLIPIVREYKLKELLK